MNGWANGKWHIKQPYSRCNENVHTRFNCYTTLWYGLRWSNQIYIERFEFVACVAVRFCCCCTVFFSVFAIITLSSSFEIVCQKQEDCGILSWYRVPLSHSHSLAPCKQLITFRFVYILFTVKCAFHSEFLTSIRNIWYDIGLGLNSVIVSTKFPGGKKCWN